ncbi:uncharacterized protein [Nicotiana sylvestris]|uniref:uncharacterized protein n=1 Tax=Nicotiana sylvestris TaxID=4096 RepID=UPI00388C58C0
MASETTKGEDHVASKRGRNYPGNEVPRDRRKNEVTLHRFEEWTLQHVPREQNSEADALANLGSSVEDDEIISGTIAQLSKLVVEEGHTEINSTSLTWDWRNKYIDYLKNGKLPSDSKESRTLRTKAARFTLSKDGTLYRRMFDGPLAICLGLGDSNYVLREIHEGTCGNHSGVESLVHKVIRAGYYWDIMEKNTKEFVRKCDKFQKHAPMIHQPGEQLHSFLSPWPFMKWGMEIVGPLPSAQAFEKVIEKEVIDLIWDHIVC